MLLLAAGNTLHVLELTSPVGESKTGGGLVPLCSANTRHMIKAISCSPSRILVADKKDSLLFFAFRKDTFTLEYLQGHQNMRLSSDCFLVSDDFAIGCDLLGSIYGLSFNTHEDTPEVVLSPREEFYYSLGETCLRVIKGSFLPPTLVDREDKMESFIAPTLLGSIVVFARVPGDENFQVLRILQNVMALHPETQPLLGSSHELYRSLLAPSRGVLDGDLLQEFAHLPKHQQQAVVDEWKRTLLQATELTVVSPELQPDAVTPETVLRLLEMLRRLAFT